MSKRPRRYDAPEISVTFDPARCIHSAECVRGLPAVFDPQRRPWIELESAGGDEIAEVVARCPTGALKYQRAGQEEEASSENSVRVSPGGPFFLRGDLELRLADESAVRDTRLALCRCGASSRKPFCDNSHRERTFDEDGELAESRLKEGSPASSAALEIKVAPGGPLLLRGPVEVVGATGEKQCGVSGALCRCGASDAKPYCDGTHRKIGFEG